MKNKIASILLGFSFLSAANIPVNFNIKNNWNLSIQKGSVSLIMLPVDIDFSTIQKGLENGDIVRIYTNEQTSLLLKDKFGVRFLAYVKITKAYIKYYVLFDENNDGNLETKKFDNYSDMKDYLMNTIYPLVKDPQKKDDAKVRDVFKNYYVPYLEKIKANGLYKFSIDKNSLSDFQIKINFINANENTLENNSQINNHSNTGGENSGGEVNAGGSEVNAGGGEASPGVEKDNLPTPPQTPNIENSNNNENNNLLTPPTTPNIGDTTENNTHKEGT